MIYYTLILIIIFIIGILGVYFTDYIKESNTTNNVYSKTDDQQRIIILFRGSKYDITDFIKRHPGGKSVLIENNGKDIEKLMVENEHSQHAYKILNKYLIS